MCVRIAMAGWLHGVFVGEWLFVFPLCGFSLSLFCNYIGAGLLQLQETTCGYNTELSWPDVKQDDCL